MLQFQVHDGANPIKVYLGIYPYNSSVDHRAAEIYDLAMVIHEDCPDAWLLNSEPELREQSLRELQRYYCEEHGYLKYFDVCIWHNTSAVHYRCGIDDRGWKIDPVPAQVPPPKPDSVAAWRGPGGVIQEVNRHGE